jgi:hypothetical protein
MIRVNAFALRRYDTARIGKMPHIVWNRAAREGRRGSGNILVLTAGADQGLKAKTRRRENAARHNEYEDIIKI